MINYLFVMDIEGSMESLCLLMSVVFGNIDCDIRLLYSILSMRFLPWLTLEAITDAFILLLTAFIFTKSNLSFYSSSSWLLDTVSVRQTFAH